MHVLDTRTAHGIGTITLSGADGNVVNTALITALFDAFSAFERDRNVNVIVLESAGDDFCRGIDTDAAVSMGTVEARALATKGMRLVRLMRGMKKVIVAAVSGACFGAGFELALASDIVFADEKAAFGFPETAMGIAPGFGGTQLAARKVYETFVKELLFTAEPVPAERLHSLGIIGTVCPSPNDTRTAAHALAETLSKKSVFAMGLAKETVNNGVEMDIERAMVFERNAFAVAFAGDDRIEGMGAFAEKREPAFTERWEDFEDMD